MEVKEAERLMCTHLASQMEGSLSFYVAQVDIALAVDQEGHQAVELLFVLSLDEAVQWCISVRVQCIVLSHFKQ